MKHKTTQPADPVVAKEILENARNSVQTDRLKGTARCVVCGADCAPNSSEQLCWVCRRLKISAWRETDQQISLQE